MSAADDMDLIREYVEANSETAFAELVRRRVNLVYSVALRCTGNSHDAQDVAQTVFVILAKKAITLRHRTILTGWLYETTRLTSGQLLRTRARQQTRDQEAYMQSTLNNSETEGLWRQLAPRLEQAMSRLSEDERTLIALRFFENRSVAEVSTALGIQEWAARKRSERAMEKLRAYFSRHGIGSTTAILAEAVSAHSIQAAPISLAKSASHLALSKGTISALAKGALKVMAWAKAKTAVAIGVAIFMAAGATTTLMVRLKNPAVAQTDFPRSSWKNAGYADPVSAFETAIWATSQSDGKILLASLTPDLQQQLGLNLAHARMSPEDFLSQPKNSADHLNGINGFHISKLKAVSEGDVRLGISIEGKSREKTFTMKKTGNEWKLDEFPANL